MLLDNEEEINSCDASLSSPPNIAELPGANLDDDIELPEFGDFRDWNTDNSGDESAGVSLMEPRAADSGEDPQEQVFNTAEHSRYDTREHMDIRAVQLSRHEARLLVNRLTGFDTVMQHGMPESDSPMSLLRRDDNRLLITRRPPVLRARSSFDRHLEQGQPHAASHYAGTKHVTLRTVHNQSIGVSIVAGLANDPGLECTTSALHDSAQRLCTCV